MNVKNVENKLKIIQHINTNILWSRDVLLHRSLKRHNFEDWLSWIICRPNVFRCSKSLYSLIVLSLLFIHILYIGSKQTRVVVSSGYFLLVNLILKLRNTKEASKIWNVIFCINQIRALPTWSVFYLLFVSRFSQTTLPSGPT